MQVQIIHVSVNYLDGLDLREPVERGVVKAKHSDMVLINTKARTLPRALLESGKYCCNANKPLTDLIQVFFNTFI